MLLLQLAGATYMDVHRAGGGIHFTVEHTRAAGSSELLASLSGRLARMQRAGTTLVECKSGYGLELQTELKMLEVIEEARRTLPINISSTYCGAHAVPKYAPSFKLQYLISHPILRSDLCCAFLSFIQREDSCRSHQGHPAGSAATAERTDVCWDSRGRQHRRVLRAGSV